MNSIKIGTRDSLLALAQAQSVADTLTQAGFAAALVPMKTTGDRILSVTLDKIGGKGLFVKELDDALRCGRADLSVHSLKDMPMDTPEDLPILAVSRRADPRDVLVLPQGADEMDLTKPIGCASARRRIQLRALYPGAHVLPVRGNVQTRLSKLDEGQFGALVLAAAGLSRLGLQDRVSRVFSVEEMLPAPGQGIVAVQGRAGMEAPYLAAYHDAAAWDCARAERAFARALSGGCTSPVAAYAVVQGDMLHLRGMYVSADEATVRFGETRGARCDAQTLGAALARAIAGEENA